MQNNALKALGHMLMPKMQPNTVKVYHIISNHLA